MAALLSSEMDGAEREKYLRRAHRRLPADGDRGPPAGCQRGRLAFSVAEEGKIQFGLGAIKGVGLKAVEAIVKARDEGGPFRDLATSSSGSPRTSSARAASRP